MSQEFAQETPSPKRQAEYMRGTSVTPEADRPMTPARKGKQTFVFELWRALHERTQHITNASPKLEFADVARKMRDKVMMETMARFWAVICSFVQNRRLKKGVMRKEMKEARILLTALMISMFPLEVLELCRKPDDDDGNDIDNAIAGQNEKDALSENCYNRAKQVVKEVFMFKPSSVHDASRLRVEMICEICVQFMDAFDAWKTSDAAKVEQSLAKYHEEWLRSKMVLASSSLNDLQRLSVLDVIDSNLMESKQRIFRLVGTQRGQELLQEIEERVASSPIDQRIEEIVNARASGRTRVAQNRAALAKEEEQKSDSALTNAEIRVKHGIPAKLMRSGIGTISGSLETSTQTSAVGTNTNTTTQTKKENELKRIDLDELIMAEGSKLYWEELGQQIAEHKYHRVLQILNEIQKRLAKLSPDSDAGYLAELIDTGFISQSIHRGVLDVRGFYSIFEGIWKAIKALHAPARDKGWVEWHDSVVSSMSESNAQWSELIPRVFNQILLKLDEIEDAVAHFQPIIKASSKLKQGKP